jgi:hypothetical protein
METCLLDGLEVEVLVLALVGLGLAIAHGVLHIG